MHTINMQSDVLDNKCVQFTQATAHDSDTCSAKCIADEGKSRFFV